MKLDFRMGFLLSNFIFHRCFILYQPPHRSRNPLPTHFPSTHWHCRAISTTNRDWIAPSLPSTIISREVHGLSVLVHDVPECPVPSWVKLVGVGGRSLSSWVKLLWLSRGPFAFTTTPTGNGFHCCGFASTFSCVCHCLYALLLWFNWFRVELVWIDLNCVTLVQKNTLII